MEGDDSRPGAGVTVEYYVKARDLAWNTAESDVYQFTVGEATPPTTPTTPTMPTTPTTPATSVEEKPVQTQ